MAGESKKNSCDCLLKELSDIKQRIDMDAETDFSEASQDASSHLRDISNVIDSKLAYLAKSCGWKEPERSQYGSVHAEGVPYASTPM